MYHSYFSFAQAETTIWNHGPMVKLALSTNKSTPLLIEMETHAEIISCTYKCTILYHQPIKHQKQVTGVILLCRVPLLLDCCKSLELYNSHESQTSSHITWLGHCHSARTLQSRCYRSKSCRSDRWTKLARRRQNKEINTVVAGCRFYNRMCSRLAACSGL